MHSKSNICNFYTSILYYFPGKRCRCRWRRRRRRCQQNNNKQTPSHRITLKRLWRSRRLKRHIINRCHGAKAITWTSKTSSPNRYKDSVSIVVSNIVTKQSVRAKKNEKITTMGPHFPLGFPLSQIDMDSHFSSDGNRYIVDAKKLLRQSSTCFFHFCHFFFSFFIFLSIHFFHTEFSCTFHDDFWTWARRASREHYTSHHKRFKYLIVGSNSSISCLNWPII